MQQPIPTPAELTALMQRKHAFLRRRNLALSPSERRAKFHQLQSQVMARLHASPEAWASFWRRNLKKRAIVWHEPG